MPLDATPVLSVLDRVTDDNGNPVSGAVLYFYEAGTSTAKTVYADAGLSVSLGVTVTCDASGYPTSNGTTRTLIYVGTASYKVVVKTSTGTTIATHDNIPGAPDIPDAQEVAIPETPVVSRTSNYTLLSTDQGKLINADCTSGTIALTLPSAVTVGDGWRVGVRHAGTANVVTVRSIAAHTIASPGQSSATSHSLIGRGHTRWYVSDGAGWTVDSEVPPLMGGPLPWFKVQDRLTAPPASPVGGYRYIINGTPTGTWATLSFAEHDVAESDGNGSWFKYTPQSGWLAYVVDEDVVTQFDGTEWDDWDNVKAPSTSIEKSLIAVNALPAGTNGGTNTATTWTNLALNTTALSTITGASHNTGAYTVTLPSGDYRVRARAAFYKTGSTLIRFKSGSTATELTSETMYIPTGTDAMVHVALSGVISVSATETFSLQYFTGTSQASSGLGRALSVPAVVERYVTLEITDIASQQGPTGAQGPQGEGGLDAAYSYKWVTSTTGDPGTGAIRGNNATIASITEIALSETDYQSTGLASVIDAWDDSTSAIKGTLKLAKEGATNNFWAFKITGAGTDMGAYRTFPVSYVASGGTLANNDICALLFIEKGDIGTPGTTVPDPSGLTVITDHDDEADYVFVTDTSTGGGLVKTLGKNLGFTATGGVLRRYQAKFRDIVDLRDFGTIDTTGASDMATFVQDAVDQTAATGDVLNVPAGKIKLGSAVTIPPGTRMRGTGQPATYSVYDTYFHFAHTGYGFVISGGANTQARELSGFGTYRTQPAITSGWAPTAHEWDILIQGASDVVLDRIHLHNATKGICSIGDATTGVNGRLSLTRISGQPFSQGLYMTHCLDAVYIDEVHFWPFFSGTLDATSQGYVYTYMRANGIAFSFGRVDNAKVGRLFSFGYSRGLYFFHQSAGSGALSSISGDASLFKADVVGCDNSSLGLLTDAATTGVSAVIDEFYAGSITTMPAITTEPVVYTLGSNGRLEIGSIYGYNTNASLVQLGGSSNWVTIGRSRSNGIDADANGTAEFHVGTGNNRLRFTHAPENTAVTKYATAGTGVIESPDWIAYTPTITAGSGTFTTVSASGRYRLQGSTVAVWIAITITTNGTAATSVIATVPVAPALTSIIFGSERVGTGVGLQGVITNGTTTMVITKSSDNTYPGASTYLLIMNGSYQV